MGWEDAHLHQFVIREKYYGIPDKDDIGVSETIDETRYKLSDVVPDKNSEFTYTYDFGDNWEHILEVEKTLPPEEGERYPLCLAGARACLPEDVGGIPGYENFLQALADPNHPEHDEYLEWIGDTFDPEVFEADEVNQLLHVM